MRAAILSTLAFAATLATAHFQVLYPPTGQPFDDEEEATGPCGGLELETSDNNANVQVDRFAISIRSTHPEGSWSFRGTQSTEAPYDFTDITPVINTQGIGDFCLTMLSVPSDWAGSSGIIQIVDNSDDGMLYQCTPVNFVEGANSTVGSACTNSSSDFTASHASGSMDSGSMSSMSMTGSMSMSSGASATGDAASSTSAPGAAAAMATGVGALAGLGMVVAGLAL